MAEILLTRHAKSYANARNLAFGRKQSPLNERGIEQARMLGITFWTDHGIRPAAYEQPVAVSEYVRPQQTARLAGFRYTEVQPIINEGDFTAEALARDVIARHRAERWVPPELQDRAQDFIDQVRVGKLEHRIYFTHGFFIAAVLEQLTAEHQAQGQVSPYVFDDRRGFIPQLATIVPVTV